jgi:hypothetical protein
MTQRRHKVREVVVVAAAQLRSFFFALHPHTEVSNDLVPQPEQNYCLSTEVIRVLPGATCSQVWNILEVRTRLRINEHERLFDWPFRGLKFVFSQVPSLAIEVAYA